MIDQLATLINWVRQHGGHLHPDVGIYLDPVTGLSFGVKPSRRSTLPAWETIVSLPTELSLSYLDAVEAAVEAPSPSSPKETDGDEEGVPRRPVPLSREIVSRAKPHVVGRLFLAKQYLAGRSSFWWPYIQSLPQPGDVELWNLPTFWPADDAELLEGTNVEIGLDKIRADVAAEYSDATHLLGTYGDEMDRAITVDLYRWAYCIFSSRSFRPSLVLAGGGRLPDGVSMDDFSVLLPLFDIGNHDMTAEVRRVNCELRVGRDFEPGHQVFNNYSIKTNAELLLGYGFMLPLTDDLHNDYIHVRKRTTEPAASEEYYISRRPMAHRSSVLGHHRSQLDIPGLDRSGTGSGTGSGEREVVGAFRHVQPDMVWDIFCTLRSTTTSDPPADERHLRECLFSGRLDPDSQEYAHMEHTVAIIQHKVMQELERLDETEVEVAAGDEEALTANQRLALDYRARCRAVLENTLEAMGDEVGA
ncbi:set domain protein [Geosmithia morbida]|uniref:Set domain protein n=1 Tax=Geosmithia morbida TaxID=1094350 RepID=A0A9P4YSZ9_9HYPO|nr:set domain protein [Geosmithia morbida]KAF4121977.1 set domain protein [Geosmithia morbida]